jgi:hypothetical protein
VPFAPLPAGASDALIAKRLADYVVLTASPDVPRAAIDYWELSVGAYQRVRGPLDDEAARSPVLDEASRHLAAFPDSVEAYRRLVACLIVELGRSPRLREAARNAIPDADEQIWIDYWLGDRHTQQAALCGKEDLQSIELPRPEPRCDVPRVQVIIPFRDAESGERTRNLLACLLALRDQERAAVGGQSVDARVIVVETDTCPRAREFLTSLADRYVFAWKDGLFNKSWAVNIGLRDGGSPESERTPELTCVLDADILVERSFLSVNASRFSNGHDAHLPYHDMTCLDASSSSLAIRSRLMDGQEFVDRALLRGLVLREPPGACLWARTGVLHKIGGFDERYEGWGGEDDDVVGRLARFHSFTRYRDPLLHMNHSRPLMTHEDGTLLNGHLIGSDQADDAWTGDREYGDPMRFIEKVSFGKN